MLVAREVVVGVLLLLVEVGVEVTLVLGQMKLLLIVVNVVVIGGGET